MLTRLCAMNMDNVRGIFFDLHGTIILSPDLPASWARWATSLHTCMTKHGLDMSEEEFAPHIDAFLERPSSSFEDDGLSLYEHRLRELGRRLGLDLNRSTLRSIVDRTIEAWYSDMYLDPEAHIVLGALKTRFKIGLITNWDHAPSIYRLLADYELEDYFETVVISDEVGVAKPDPRIFHIALRRAGLEPEEAAYVGDGPEDVEGSMAAGLHPILIKRKQRMKVQNDAETHPRSADQSTVKPDNLQVVDRLGALLEIFRLEARTNSNKPRCSAGCR